MTEFLIEIGCENRPASQDADRRYVQDEQKQIDVALALGDIKQIGTTPKEEEDDPPWHGDYPIYQFVGPQITEQRADNVCFTLDPRLRGSRYGNPPHIDHNPGQVHCGMHEALWAAYCYDHPGAGLNTDENYYALLRGIMWRYAGENMIPEFVPETGYEEQQ
ncbi:MAG: hypothetical protein ACRC9R_01155 [Enterovibrio sp.]